MSIQLINPEGLPQVEVYSQVSVATGTRFVSIAGQVARLGDGTPVGAGDLAAQTEQAYRNVATALAAAGGDFSHVTKLTVYVPDWTPDKMGPLIEGSMRAAGALSVTSAPPITLIGVAALAEPDLLVEIQADAVID